jgi:hypothetical protein
MMYFGRLTLSDATVTWPPLRNTPEEPEDPESFSGRTYWDLLASSGGNVAFRSVNAGVDMARADVTTETGKFLRILGHGHELGLDGRIRPLRGRIQLFLTDINIDPDKESYVEFRRQEPPYISLWGYNNVKGTRIDVYAHGEIEKIQVELKSADPSLTQEQLASMMVGVGSDDPGQALGSLAG